MKQFKFFAVALAALTMFSCSKENIDDSTERVMTVKIANPASTKLTEAPGSSLPNTITLENGVIFTLLNDAVVGAYELDVTAAATATGQVVGNVTGSTKVFVVANVPAAKATEWTTAATRPASLDAIKKLALSIADDNGSDYTKATLCNTLGTVTTPTANGDGKVLATVEISPVYSRLELPKVVCAGSIASFEVKGVYVDDFYTSYTVGGSFEDKAGDDTDNINSMGQTPPPATWPTVGKDEGTWASNNKIAELGAGVVWAYNLPSGNLPRLVIKLENIKLTDGTAMTGTYYITVKSYKDNLTVFAPGNIYNIAEGIKFEEKDLGPTPNPTESELSVAVTIKQWTIKSVGVTL